MLPGAVGRLSASGEVEPDLGLAQRDVNPACLKSEPDFGLAP